jgi:hypothetical protein
MFAVSINRSIGPRGPPGKLSAPGLDSANRGYEIEYQEKRLTYLAASDYRHILELSAAWAISSGSSGSTLRSINESWRRWWRRSLGGHFDAQRHWYTIHRTAT